MPLHHRLMLPQKRECPRVRRRTTYMNHRNMQFCVLLSFFFSYWTFSAHRTRNLDFDTIRTLSPTPQNNRAHYHHRIPNILIFTHHLNFLSNETYADSEHEALRLNVHRSINFHPTAHVRFLNDDDCRRSIYNVLDDALAYELTRYFDQETIGMFKADICRGAALYETGGIYLDVDVGVRYNVFRDLNETTEFATVKVHKLSKYKDYFFQAFIGVTPRHPVILRYLELFLSYYRGDLPMIRHSDPVGVILLQMAYASVQPDNAELWQEVLYTKRGNQRLAHVPPPFWGGERSCKFVVVANTQERRWRVPLYSRIGGSRMCPFEVPLRFQVWNWLQNY